MHDVIVEILVDCVEDVLEEAHVIEVDVDHSDAHDPEHEFVFEVDDYCPTPCFDTDWT